MGSFFFFAELVQYKHTAHPRNATHFNTEVTTQNTTHVHTLATHPGTLYIPYYVLNNLYSVFVDGVDLSNSI